MKRLLIIIICGFILFSEFSFAQVRPSRYNSKKKLETNVRPPQKIKVVEDKNNNNNKFQYDEREFRGIWVSSVWNIDWPSKTGLTEYQQKQEFLELLENVQKWNMNAVVVQIKPMADAFYPSKLSPWSFYLTGIQGQNPGYDPLKFMIEESHKRGIQFHAWFNPYRISINNDRSKLSHNNIAIKKPEWVVNYAGKLFLNPGAEGVDDYVVESIMEVVKNYDIDGVHLDDYFYPYRERNLEYNDKVTYNKLNKGRFNNISDWRRDNVNKLVEKLSKEIKEEKKNVSFGISPFGVWRNDNTDPEKGSQTRASIQNYDDLYADILLWMDKEWIDYVAPQIYWHKGFDIADYEVLVRWWSDIAKSTKTDLYIGHAAYKIKDWKKEEELIDQIYFNRNFAEIKGSIFFSYSSLLKNPKRVLDRLMEGPYADNNLRK